MQQKITLDYKGGQFGSTKVYKKNQDFTNAKQFFELKFNQKIIS